MEPNFEAHTSEYQRFANTSLRRERRQRSVLQATGRLNSGGSEAKWSFTGKKFSEGRSNRETELAGRGCGIFPRVHPDEDPRISEVPVTSRLDLRFATTALAQMGGLTPRARCVDDSINRLKRDMTTWHEHDHSQSSGVSKQLRAHRVAGVNSARLGYINTHPGHRQGVEDRPTWMSENEHLPGGFHYTPSDPHSLLPEGTPGRGDPTIFGRESHFSHSFNPRGA